LASAVHVERAGQRFSFATSKMEVSSHRASIRRGPFPNDCRVPGRGERLVRYLAASFQWEEFTRYSQEAIIGHGAYGGEFPVSMFREARGILAEFDCHLVLPTMMESCGGAVSDEAPFVREASDWPSEVDLELGPVSHESAADILGYVVILPEEKVRELEVVKVSPQSFAVLEEL
jgi:hypothetical protein